jgi:CRP/FNR family transcriptional regulator, cyclic AMP receptor protein
MRHFALTAQSRAFLTYVVGHGSIVHFRKSQVAFFQGSASSAMFCLNRGIVKLSVGSKQGREAIIRLVGPGEFFGEDALIHDNNVRPCSAVCLSEAHAVKIDCQPVAETLKTRADISYDFVMYLLRHNRELQEHLANCLLYSGAERLVRALSSVPNEERLGQLATLSQQTLAEMIGTTRQHTNALLKEFRRLRQSKLGIESIGVKVSQQIGGKAGNRQTRKR